MKGATMKSAIIKAIANGVTSVYALTHSNSIGNGNEVHNELMRLVADGILTVKNDGRTVELA